MNDFAIKAEGVTKQYRLGTIGGGTLRGDLQSAMARLRGKDDPNAKIGAKAYARNEKFLALDDVSFEVKPGEALGIIGHNGAGKSTLLKILSRVTAPTKGQIEINGRIASMLEVGTGFHPELTGRENVYLNGAILGMTKAEIKRKFDDIVEFAEMEQFIDTPVKRYSSGMYVKLAFSVAAHLDSEIMVMDEVLAVGDMKFQQKCLGKMGDAAGREGRTVLYVSHNMNTIRQLCTRCLVLDHGKKIFDGDTEEAISNYLSDIKKPRSDNDLTEISRSQFGLEKRYINMTKLILLGSTSAEINVNEPIEMKLDVTTEKDITNIMFRMIVFDNKEAIIGMASTCNINTKASKGENSYILTLNLPNVVEGKYSIRIVAYIINEYGTEERLDVADNAISIVITDKNLRLSQLKWESRYWGSIKFPPIKIKAIE